VTNFGDLRERHLSILHGVVGDDIHHGRRSVAESMLELVVSDAGRLTDRHDTRAGEANSLLDRGAVVDEVSELHNDLVLHPNGVRQLFDPSEVRAGHAPGDRQGHP
jgi:hypothetical protein